MTTDHVKAKRRLTDDEAAELQRKWVQAAARPRVFVYPAEPDGKFKWTVVDVNWNSVADSGEKTYEDFDAATQGAYDQYPDARFFAG